MCLISKQKRSIKKDPFDIKNPLTIRRSGLSANERAESSGKSNRELAPRHRPVRLCLAAAAFIALWFSATIAYAGPFDFSPSDFNIMDADGTVGERQHRDLLRWCLLIVGGNRELGAARIEFNDAVVSSRSTMRRCVFSGQEEWARLVLCRRCRACKQKHHCYKTGKAAIETKVE
jgi:hypothetical protein